MNNILTFIIPVKHPENTANWKSLKLLLQDTIKSIQQQDHPAWKAVIVANEGSDIPDLPPRFEVKRVDFSPNPLYTKNIQLSQEEHYQAIRLDKGRRILAGLLHAGKMGYVMIVDADDLVSRQLTSFVSNHWGENGWYLRDGYIWDDKGKFFLYKFTDFSRLCGTSHIIRADLYNIPLNFGAASDDYIRRVLGSHIFLHADLDKSGTPLAALPFIGAIYRIGNSEAYTQSQTIRKTFFHKGLLSRPRELFRRIMHLRIKSTKIKHEFFGL